MTGSNSARPPFRVEHVGSFVRPGRLLEAARANKAGALDDRAYAEIQNDCIREIVAFQDELGLPSVTDGEFRRRVWSGGLTEALDGMGLKAEGMLSFHSESEEYGVPPSPYAEGRLSRRGPIVTGDYEFVASLRPKGVPKVTIASPAVLHFWLGDGSFNPAVYDGRDDFFADLIAIFREEIADLEQAGCRYVQLDDTALPCNCDDTARAAVVARGEDPDELTDAYVQLINACVGERRDDTFAGLHMCRGNLKTMWMAEGGYEPIAERLFGGLDVDAFFLEYDSERAGDFRPLRFLPPGKTAVLGLVSTKTAELESKDDLKRRIDDAARCAPLEQLSLSPQCGFSSAGGGGQVMGLDEIRRKLDLIRDVAAEVWG